MLFENLSRTMIQQGLARARKEAEEKRRKERDELDEFYAGGSSIRSKLTQHPGELSDEYTSRQTRIIYPNYVARLADALIDGAYGDPVVRSFQDATDQHEETLQSIWDWNVMLRVQREIAYGIVVLGDAWVNCAWRDAPEDKTVASFAVHPNQIGYTTDPDNPNRTIELVETRAVEDETGRDKRMQTHWVWTMDEYGHFDDDGRPVDDGDWPQRNPYGLIPYVHFRGRPMIGTTDGLSYIRDAITIQRALLNRLSDEDVLCIEQTHGTLVLKSHQRATSEHGPRRAITVPTDGDAFYINPNAAIRDLEESIDRLVRMLFETGSVPMSLVTGGTASSGLQLAIEMRPFTRVVETVRAECVAAEKQLIRTVCKIAHVHGMGLPEDVLPIVEFSDNVLPSDREAEFNRDMLMYQNDLMLREDFIRRWIDKLGDDNAAIDEYMRLLDEENSGKHSASETDPFGLSWGSGGGSKAPDPPGPYVPPDSSQSPTGPKFPSEAQP